MSTFVGKSNKLINETNAELACTDGLNGPVCPVCNKSLGQPECCYDIGISSFNPIISKNYKVAAKDSAARRKQLEEEWEGRRHRKPDSEVVIAATCGELFHKACLMKFCASSFKLNKRFGSLTTNLARKEMEKTKDKSSHSMPQCPRCSRYIIYTYHREIDLDSHRINGPNEFDRDFAKTEVMGQELKDQYERETQNLERIEKVLTDAEFQLRQAKESQKKTDLMIPKGGFPSSIKDDLNTFKKRKKEHKTMESYIEKAQKVIEYMQKETPVIMKMYLKQVKGRSREDIIKNSPIPAIFVDYLDKICEDEFCLFALSQIIKPAPYPGANFDENRLVASILGKVDPVLKHKLERRASKLGHADLLVAYENLYPEVNDKQTETTNELTSKISSRLIKFDGITICEIYENNNGPPSQHVLAMDSNVEDVLSGDKEVSTTEIQLSDLISKSASQLLDEAVEQILCSPTTEESDSELSESAYAPTTEYIHVRQPNKSTGSLNCLSSESAFDKSCTIVQKLKKSKKSPRCSKSSTSVSRVESEELLRDCSSISVMVSDYEGDENYKPKPIVFEGDENISTEQFIRDISKYDDAMGWSNDEQIDLGKPETPQFPEKVSLSASDKDNFETSGDESSLKLDLLPCGPEAIPQQTEVFIAQCQHLISMSNNATSNSEPNEPKQSDISGIESELDSEAEYVPSGNPSCTTLKTKSDISNSAKTTTGFLEFFSAKEIKEMKGPLRPPSPSTPVFVTCIAPNLSKFDSGMNPHFPKAPEIVAYGPLKNTDGTNLKVPLAYLGHYPPKHEINRTWVTQMESPTNLCLGDWHTPPDPSPGHLYSPPVPPKKVTSKLASKKFNLSQPFPHTATYFSMHKQVGEAHLVDSYEPDEPYILPSKYSVMLSYLEMGPGQDDQVSSNSKDVPRVNFNVVNETTSAADSHAKRPKKTDTAERKKSNSTSGFARKNAGSKSKSPKSIKTSAGKESMRLDITTPATTASGVEEWNKYGMLKRSAKSISSILSPRRNKSLGSVEPSSTRRLGDPSAERKRSLPGMRKAQFRGNDIYYYLEESGVTGGRKKLWKSNFFSGKSKQKD